MSCRSEYDPLSNAANTERRKDQTATDPHQGAFKRDAQPVEGARYSHTESFQVKVFLADV